MQMLTRRQSFLYVVSQGATTLKDEGEGRTKWLPLDNQNFMLLFAGCNNKPYLATWWPAAQVCWGWVRQVRQRQHVHWQRCVHCQRQVHLVCQGCCVRCWGQVWQERQGGCIHQGGPQRASFQRRQWQPLDKNGNWAGCNNEPLSTRAIGHVCHESDHVCCAMQQ